MKTTRIPFICALMAGLVLLTGCAAQQPAGPSAEGGGPVPLTLYLSFIPNVQFAPVYVGLEEGTFEAAGIDLNVEHLAETDALKLVAAGDAPAAAIVSGEQVLLARQQGLPVVYVFEWYERFPVGVASKAEAGIEAPADLAGRRVGVPALEGASYIGLEALLFSADLTDADISLEATGFTQVETLLSDRAEAVVVYLSNEPIQLEAEGAAVNLIEISQHANLVSNGLVVSEQMIAEQPELVRSLVQAYAEALATTIADPELAYAASQQYVEGLADDDAAQREVLARSIELWQAERLGETDPAAWEEMAGVLRRMGLLPEAADLDLSAAYTNAFVP